MARARWIVGAALVVSVTLLVGCGSESAFKTDGSTPGVGPDEDVVDTTAVPASVTSLVEFRPVLTQTLPPSGTTSLCEPGDPASIDPALPSTADQCEDGILTSSYELGPSLLDGSAIESARASIGQNGQWVVNPVFKEGAEGIDAFNAAAAICTVAAPECRTRQLAIVVDGQVVSAPSINQADYSRDQIQISGTFTETSARVLAARLSPS